jgi:hypothetical protein
LGVDESKTAFTNNKEMRKTEGKRGKERQKDNTKNGRKKDWVI